MTAPRRKRPDAFTLVESLLAAVILAMTVSSMVVPFVAGAQNDQAAGRGAVAITLAQDLMEEILAKPFSDPDDGNHEPGPDGDEPAGRALFDNIDDYHGYTEPPGAIIPHQGGAPMDDHAATLSRRAEVAYVSVSGQDGGEEAVFCRVIVRVDWREDNLVTLTRLVYANE